MNKLYIQINKETIHFTEIGAYHWDIRFSIWQDGGIIYQGKWEWFEDYNRQLIVETIRKDFLTDDTERKHTQLSKS